MPEFLTVGFVPDLAVRATLVLAGALLASLALRRGSAGARHAFWTVVTVALLLLPALNALLPPLAVGWIPAAAAMLDQPEVVAASETATIVAPTASVTSGSVAEGAPDAPPIAATASTLPPARLALIVWLLGVIGCALPIAVGIHRAGRLVREARPSAGHRVRVRADAIAAAVGLKRPLRVVLSAEVRTPMTSGVLSPAVLLPSDALSWDDDRLDAVLRHELVHARRADVLWQLLSRLSVACYWFHPLAWDAARRASLAREQACDEAVLRQGTRPSQYARHLLDLAEPRTEALMLPAMVRLDHPHLEERVMAILTSTPARHSSRRIAFASSAVAVWTLGVASVTPGTAQVPLPPAAPEAPGAPPVAPAPPATVPATAPSAPVFAAGAAPAAPVAPTASSSHVAAPAAPTAPASAIGAKSVRQGDDCDYRNGSYRTTGDGGRARVLSTTEGGIRICATIRGDVDSDGFLPAGTLPAGTTMTLATTVDGHTQRLVVTGGSGRNTHQWFVDGRERPYDRVAEEWHVAMIDLLRSLDGKYALMGEMAQLRGEIARVRGREAQVQGRIAHVRGQDAALAGAEASVRGQIAAERAVAAGRRSAAATERDDEWVARQRGLEAEAVAARERRSEYRVEERVRALEAERSVLRTDDSVRAIQGRIERLDADQRIAEIEQKMTPQVVRLQRAIESVN